MVLIVGFIPSQESLWKQYIATLTSDPRAIKFQELQGRPIPSTHQMCTAPNSSKQRGVEVICPHSGSDCMRLGPGFAGYELRDSGQVFFVPQFSHLQIR